jgi:DNA-binding winged helix-turn-helix (wHTH) protein
MQTTTPPLRDRDEAALAAALCLMFGLRRSEGQVLMLMSTQDFVSKKEIHAAASRDDQTIAESSVSVLISGLRKKLIVYNIEISTLRGFGYALRKESRGKIYRRLVKYDAALIPTSPQKPKTVDPDEALKHV